MPAQFRFAQTSFSAGEVSPEMWGRTDTAKHQNGLKKSVNAYISPFGGAVRRNGSRFVNTAKYSNKDVVLIKFVFSVDQSYMVELGEFYMRFYINKHVIRDQNGSIYEIATPYRETDLKDVKYTQCQDTMFLVHENYPIQELKRYGDASWVLNPAVFNPMPFEETTPTPVAYLKFDTPDKEEGKQVIVTTYMDSMLTGRHHGFTLDDVGARISVNSGVLRITGVTNTYGAGYSTAICTVVYALSSVITAIPNSWTLLHPGWSDRLGYPSATYIHQQRLIFASSKKFPRKIWMSTTGNPYNFDTADSSDDDALSVGIDDNQGNKIIHLAQDQVLLALTAGNEFSITGGYENGIKPSNINIRLQSSFGSANVRPINIDASMFFVQRAGKQLKAVSNGGYYGTDVEWATLSEMSRHLLVSGIKSVTYQQDPNSIIYAVCNNGNIAALTYNAEQEIAGWGSIETQGDYMFACCIPERTKDVVYTAVRRNIAGSNVICIEVFDPELNTDCAISGYNNEGANVWFGLDHLDGHTVSIIADGVVMPEQRVNNGSITLDREARSVEVGLNYETKLDLLFQDFPTSTGSTVGARLTLSEVTFRFYQTKGATVTLYGESNKQVLTSRKFGNDLLDKRPPDLESTIKLDSLGWDINEINLTIEQTQPLPFHLMAVSYMVTTG